MVNLKQHEIEYLKERKQMPEPKIKFNTEAFHYEQDKHRIFVCLNSSKKNLPSFLKWRIEQCYKLLHDEKNYNFTFELVEYQDIGSTFANVVTLKLIRVYGNGSFPVLFAPKTKTENKPFTFQVQLSDLDIFFKRQYIVVNPNISCYLGQTTEGVNVKIKENLENKTITLTNTEKLLVDCPDEPFITASVKCHKDDTYNYTIGRKLVEEKWKEKYREWFKNYSMNEVKKEIEQKEEEDKNMAIVMLTNTQTNQATMVKTKKSPADFVTTSYDTSFIKDIKNKDAVGIKLGNLFVESLFRDCNKHVVWKLTCPKCGGSIFTNRSKLEKNKVDVHCKICTQDSDTSKCEDNCADFVSDPDNTVSTNANSLTTDEDNNSMPYMTTCSNSPVRFSEITGNLFDAPVWSYVAHCINADYGFFGPIAETIDNMWNMKERLNHDYDLNKISVGSACTIDNVFNLIVAPNGYTPPTLNTLDEAVHEMAEICYALGVQMVSMPKLCCGKNKLQWSDVKPRIIDIFNRVYTYKNDRYDKNQTIDLCVYSL